MPDEAYKETEELLSEIGGNYIEWYKSLKITYGDD